VKTGDGLLVEFPNLVEAVSCAAAVQQEMPERNTTIASDRRIEFRVGSTRVPCSSKTAHPSEKPSLAVLPFQNMPGDPEQE
jgi:class 3 adenylate cyclase